MSSGALRTAIRSEMQLWAGQQNPVVEVVNTVNTNQEPGATPWLTAEFEMTASEALCPGKYLEEGLVELWLAHPSGEGDAAVLALADSLAAHFRAATFGGEIDLYQVEEPRETAPLSGQWFIVQVTCNYQRFIN